MSRVKGKLKLMKVSDGFVLILIDPANLKALCVDKFIKHDTTVSVILDLEIKRPYLEKTLSQLGYMHAAIWPVFYQYYRDQGIPVETEEQREDVRTSVKLVIGFTKEIETPSCETVGWTHRTDVNWKNDVPKSFADASKEETSEAIEAIIRLGAEFGMIIEDAATYLERHNKSEFES